MRKSGSGKRNKSPGAGLATLIGVHALYKILRRHLSASGEPQRGKLPHYLGRGSGLLGTGKGQPAEWKHGFDFWAAFEIEFLEPGVQFCNTVFGV